jgi:hypothetical protein
MEGFEGLSKGTITATLVSTFAQFALSFGTIRRAGERGKGRMGLTRLGQPWRRSLD